MLFEHVAQLLDKLESGYRVFHETAGKDKKKEVKKELFYGELRSFRDEHLCSGRSFTPAYLIFSLLCPGEDIERKYGLKSLSLSKLLIKVYGRSRRVEVLNDVDEGTSRRILQEIDISLTLESIVASTNFRPSSDTIEEINSLLDQLASTCKFSSNRVKAIKTSFGSQRDIISRLFLMQSAVAAKWLVRIILKTPNSWSLNSFMVAFHLQMVDIFAYKSDLLACCNEVDVLWKQRTTAVLLTFRLYLEKVGA
jgi:hypothetical protein